MNPNDTKPTAPEVPDTPQPAETPTQTQQAPTVASEPEASEQQPIVSQPVAAEAPVQHGSRKKKLAIIGGVSVAVLLAGLAVAYFGWWTRSTTVYSHGVSNLGKGIEELSNTLLESAESGEYKAVNGDGSYEFITEGTTVKGKMGLKASETAFQLTMDADLGIKKIDVDIRGFGDDKETTDVFLKANNITGLGALTGSAELSAAIDQLSGKWISVDKELLEMAEQSAGASATSSPTREQIASAVQAINKTNREYVFTANQDKAIWKVIKTYGKEQIDGHSTYRYQAEPVKEHMVDYLTALEKSIKESRLKDWLKQNQYERQLTASFNDARRSARELKPAEARFDIWSDINSRVLYKARFADRQNPKTYFEVGLDYKGGDEYPLFVNAVEEKTGEDSRGTLRLTVNSKTSIVTLKGDVGNKKSQDGFLAVNAQLTPTKDLPKIDKPTSTVPLSQVLQALGLDGLLQAQAGAAGGATGIDPTSLESQ